MGFADCAEHFDRFHQELRKHLWFRFCLGDEIVDRPDQLFMMAWVLLAQEIPRVKHLLAIGLLDLVTAEVVGIGAQRCVWSSPLTREAVFGKYANSRKRAIAANSSLRRLRSTGLPSWKSPEVRCPRPAPPELFHSLISTTATGEHRGSQGTLATGKSVRVRTGGN